METSVAQVFGYANKFAVFVDFVFAGSRILTPVKTTRRHHMTPNSLLHDILGAILIAALILITSFYC